MRSRRSYQSLTCTAFRRRLGAVVSAWSWSELGMTSLDGMRAQRVSSAGWVSRTARTSWTGGISGKIRVVSAGPASVVSSATTGAIIGDDELRESRAEGSRWINRMCEMLPNPVSDPTNPLADFTLGLHPCDDSTIALDTRPDTSDDGISKTVIPRPVDTSPIR